MTLKYTVEVTCHSTPLQIEGLSEDDRTYFFYERQGDWYMSIIPLTTDAMDDMARVLPVHPVAKGHVDEWPMSEKLGRKIVHEYITQPGLINRKSAFGIAYEGIVKDRPRAERELRDGKVITHTVGGTK